ncbi:MAG TPA: hypothetical protein VJ856_02960 [Paludibacteraceae bacterium]|nr:hypothetical protein [Paludibacteraceae bacterium]
MKKISLLITLSAICLNLLAGTYTRIGIKQTDWSGDYIVVYEFSATKGYVFNLNDVSGNFQEVTLSNGKITANVSDYQIKVAKESANAYSLHTSQGYMGGEAKKNKIVYSSGATECAITYTAGATQVTANSGTLSFLYNPQDPRFRFYYDTSKKWDGKEHIQFYKLGDFDVVDSSNDLATKYVQADFYARYSDWNNNLFYCQLQLAQSDYEEGVPYVWLGIHTNSLTSLAGSYSSKSRDDQAGYIFTNNSADTGITFPSSEGGTNGKISEATLTLTPTSKVNDSLYNFQIELRLIDSNKKVWTLNKELPIHAYFIDRVLGNELEDMDPVWQTLIEKVGTNLNIVSAAQLNIYSVDGTILGLENLRIYNLTGQDVTSMNGNLRGVYIVVSDNKVAKIQVK